MNYTVRMNELSDLTLQFFIDWTIANILNGEYEFDGPFSAFLDEKLRRNEIE